MLGIQKEYMITSIEELEGLLNNSSSESINSQLKVYKEQIDKLNYNFSHLFLNFVNSLVWGFIIAAIIGRIVRRNPDNNIV